MAAVDWTRIRFAPDVIEAAAVVAECHVALDAGEGRAVTYEIRVYAALKGDGDEPYFAVGTPGEAQAFRPVGSGATPEDALQCCLADAGIHHRRLQKQARET